MNDRMRYIGMDARCIAIRCFKQSCEKILNFVSATCNVVLVLALLLLFLFPLHVPWPTFPSVFILHEVVIAPFFTFLPYSIPLLHCDSCSNRIDIPSCLRLI